MKIIKASVSIEAFTPSMEWLIERAGRVCYKSEDRITDRSAEKFIKRLIESHHESVLEHGVVTVRFIVDRGISHQLVRHRHASPTQESTRYCCYTKERFGSELTVIDPVMFKPNTVGRALWWVGCKASELIYKALIWAGHSAQEARTVLPQSTKTELVVTANAREWRHIFRERCAPAAHTQMREVMEPLRDEFVKRWPAIFGDMAAKTGSSTGPA